MFPCEHCGKVYSTKHSRSSHRYAYHKKPAIVATERATDSDIDNINTNHGSDHEDVDSNVDEGVSDSERSLDVDDEVDKKAKTDKFPCEQCGKVYSTKHSRSSHRYKYHKSTPTGGTEHTTNPDSDPNGSAYEDVTSIIDELGSDSEHSLETEDEVDKNPKASSKYYTDDSDGGSNTSPRFDKSPGKSRRKQFARRHQPYQTNRFVDKKLDKILEEIESLGNKQNPINVNEAINHPQLIKMLCKAVLDSSMSLQKTHIDALKPHRETIRKIAHGRSATRTKLIQSEVDRHNQTGESILKTILDRMMTLFTYII